MIDILGLDQRLDVVFENFGEVVLKFGSSEVFQDIRPVGRNLDDCNRFRGEYELFEAI